MSTGSRQITAVRSMHGSKSEDSVFVSVTTEEVEEIVRRATAAVVKEVQQLINDKLDEVQRQMQDNDERLKKLEGIMNDKRFAIPVGVSGVCRTFMEVGADH